MVLLGASSSFELQPDFYQKKDSHHTYLDAAEEDDVDEDARESGDHLLGLVVVEARQRRQAEDHNVEHRYCLRIESMRPTRGLFLSNGWGPSSSRYL